jgi:anti-sigma regulatory factor (Ser/Thr protein kinase)
MSRTGKETSEMEPLDALQMNGKQSRAIRLSVNPQADFRQVIHTLEAIVLPPVRVNEEHVRFAVLELLNNSIRAHREKGESRDISIDLAISDGRLVVQIRDFGGGFDTGKLPYSLEADPSRLDLHSPEFEEYQKRNGFKRFGMGIYVAKKTFDEFRLVFFDERDQPMSWSQGKTVGTLIILSVGTRSSAGGSAPRGKEGSREAANGN